MYFLLLQGEPGVQGEPGLPGPEGMKGLKGNQVHIMYTIMIHNFAHGEIEWIFNS